jgi:FtsP/CotA-like multicopper oxidase with cupredoxin domain
MLSSHIVSTKGRARPPLLALGVALYTISTVALAQSFFTQCPNSTLTHPASGALAGSYATHLNSSTAPNSVAIPNSLGDSGQPAYTGPQAVTEYPNGVPVTYILNGGSVKCQQISGGDGLVTMGNGNQTFMFAFGPLSGLHSIANGLPGTDYPDVFNLPYCDGPTYTNGQPNPYWNSATSACVAKSNPDGAVGINTAPSSNNVAPGLAPDIGVPQGTDGAAIMNTGVMNGNLPAPWFAFDEDDEFFLTLTNVGMIMRPDLFEQHTVHFHGYPNASSFYDGVPDASLAINIGGSFTYYYMAPDAGTYFWHCHITPPEHLQMGMVGHLYVRPRQDRVPVGTNLFQSLAGCAPVSGVPTNASCPARSLAMVVGQQSDLRTACNPASDILCSVPLPAADIGAVHPATGAKYVYNDGDGSTWYDVDVPLHMHGFDPNFHFVGMTFNPEGFADMKDKNFLLNGRSYPDTVGVTGYQGLAGITETNPDGSTTTNPAPGNAITTMSTDGFSRPSQPLPSLVTLSNGTSSGRAQRAALHAVNLSVTEYHTLATLGLPMTIVGFNAKILRDQAGNNLYIKTNSINLGGGESLDAILDACAVRGPGPKYACITPVPAGTYFLYTPQLDHLSNDAENFGGMMTEVVVTN